MEENEEYNQIMQVACDEICKFPYQLDELKLETQCDKCPLAAKVRSALKQ